MAPFKMIIIGCGLAGGLLANGLLHNDVDFIVYEADEPSSTREGYQIRLGSPALTGFKACLTTVQQEQLYKMFGRSGGVVSSAPILYDTNMKMLLDLTKFPAYTKSAPINRVVLRNFLHDPLIGAGKVVFQKKFSDYRVVEQQGGAASKITVFFEDGTSDVCDLLVSAEGSVSRINRQIGLDNILQLRERWGFLAKGPLPLAKLKTLPAEVRRGPVSVVTKSVVLFYSAYLPSGSQDDVSARKKASDLDYDYDNASLFWGLQIPTELCPDDPRKIEDKIGFCLEIIKEWDPRFHDMLRATTGDDIYVFQARASSPPPKQWREKAKQADDLRKANSHVWLLGDAVHPMLPSRGMGGNQSLRDTADMLPQILTLAHKARDDELQEEDFSTAVELYEKSMIPRAFKWVKISGGTQTKLMDTTTFRGKIVLFLMARILDFSHMVSILRLWLGYKIHDDAPELPN